MTDKIHVERVGILDSLTNLAASLVAIAHTRLELLSVDLEEEREHLLLLLVCTLTALFCIGVGVVLSAILLVAIFWDSYRLQVLGFLAVLFLVVGIATWLHAMRRARTKPRLFEASLTELFKDRQQLDSRS